MERIATIWLTMEVRMVAGPPQVTIRQLINAVNIANLEPAPQPVKRAGLFYKLPAPALFFHVPKQTEKQEQIPHPHLLFTEVPLCSAGLPQAGPPAGFPG